ncbi:MAG: AraC family transcriptional regulator [Rariglobus sp.]|nr:AraC family transcriptional regulator [Rariglobus sp.]
MSVSFPAAGVVALESRHAKGFLMKPTTHDYLKVIMVFSGEGMMCGPGWEQPLRPADVVVVLPGCEHRIKDRRPLFLYVLCFRTADFENGWKTWAGKSGIRCIRDGAGPVLALTRRLLHEQWVAQPAGDVMSRGLGWEILAWLARAPVAARPAGAAHDPTGSRARVLEAALELSSRFYEPLNLEDAARRARLGRRRFTQLFKEVNGVTWWDALSAARLAHAERLLGETDRSVAAVAFECGYGDLSGFYRAWAAGHKASPQVWRRRGQARENVS